MKDVELFKINDFDPNEQAQRRINESMNTKGNN